MSLPQLAPFVRGVLALCLLSITGLPARATGTLPVVAEGAPRCVVVLPAQAAADETRAADELAEYLRKITGVTPPRQTSAPAEVDNVVRQQTAAGRVPIVLGLALTPEAEARIRAQGSDPASFLLRVDAQAIRVAGLSPQGTYFGACELLEQLGVRWFMPGDFGTVIPRSKDIAVRQQETIQVPSFPHRHFQAVPDDAWQRHMRAGGIYFVGAHGIDLGPEGAFAKHPEYWAEIDGKRRASQVCVSNPEVVRLAIARAKAYFQKNPTAVMIGMGPNDGSGFCECANCRALDGGEWDVFSNEPSVTDRYIWFYNQVLTGIEDEFPEKKIAFYAYHTYMRPPVKVKPDPRILPALAPIALCRAHGMDNPVCPEKRYLQWLYREWGKAVPEVFDRGYWFNLADPGFPFPMASRLRADIPMAKALGVTGWRVECMPKWACESPSLYIAGKLMWDHTADVDALLRDYHDKFFGPAAAPMGKYLTLMDAALRDADYHTGCAFDMPHFYPPAVRAKARRLLADAAWRARTGLYARRVRAHREAFDALEAFIAMLDHRGAGDFVRAKRDLDRLRALQKTLLAYNPPMLHPQTAGAYLQRFFSACTEQGYARVTGGNTRVAVLPDVWDFQLDPQSVGEEIGLFRPDAGGNWQRLATWSRSWSDQGLRMYRGAAWYRAEVTIPQRYAGRRLFLWFGGVDEKAKVWLNGTPLGISHSAAFIPFELDATPAMRPGRNVVTVCVRNTVVDELGTGGIMAPVMFYAPAAGDAATLENARPLAPTFP